mmetsp:Transcript_34649/g.87093  ORF Transcript_34649/g.87093 Transcript_34649/m.87093 type:complete len:251 (+) Transcript_34649:207-959(+)
MPRFPGEHVLPGLCQIRGATRCHRRRGRAAHHSSRVFVQDDLMLCGLLRRKRHFIVCRIQCRWMVVDWPHKFLYIKVVHQRWGVHQPVEVVLKQKPPLIDDLTAHVGEPLFCRQTILLDNTGLEEPHVQVGELTIAAKDIMYIAHFILCFQNVKLQREEDKTVKDTSKHLSSDVPCSIQCPTVSHPHSKRRETKTLKPKQSAYSELGIAEERTKQSLLAFGNGDGRGRQDVAFYHARSTCCHHRATNWSG